MKIDNPKIKNLEDKKLIIGEDKITGIFTDEVIPKNYHFLEFDTCIMNHITMCDIDLSKSSFMDVKFIDCDLSNTIFESTSFNRVIFENCRLVGVSITDSSINNTQFINCNLEYSNFSVSKFKNVNYDNSKIGSSSFNEVLFKDTIFEKCNLNNAEFIGTKLKDMDFSTSEINNIIVDYHNLQGCSVNMMQAVAFAKYFGLNIK